MTNLPIPSTFDKSTVGSVYRVPYQARSHQAKEWANQHSINASAKDKFRICLMLIDVQNTFCIPDYELFVGGRPNNGYAHCQSNFPCKLLD